jgi:hypothetical protein
MKQVTLSIGVLMLSAAAAAAQTAQTVFISEIMVGQDRIYCDSFGDDPDWIEIHNPTDTTADLAGWFLSDKPTVNIKRWSFPPNTIIPARGYLVVFFQTKNAANRKRTDGADLHANFRLPVQGDVIVLVNPKSVEVHRVRFGPQQRNRSIGTLDPFEPLEPQKWPTPGVANDAPRPASRCR